MTQTTTKKNETGSASRSGTSSKPSIVRIVGTGDGIVMRIGDQDGRWADIVRVLSGHLSRSEGFFQGERVAIEIGSRLLSADDLQQIADILAGYNVAIWAVRTSNPQTQQMVQEIGLSAELLAGEKRDNRPAPDKTERAQWEVHLGARAPAPPPVIPQSEFQPPQSITDSIVDRAIEQPASVAEESTGKAGDRASEAAVAEAEAWDADDEQALPEMILAPPYIYRGTLRSGQVFRHAGTVMIIGDVNPGAEVISGGDIFVWGRLRGIVHAGAMGNERSVVCAIDFEPIQLRIAGYIAMSPKAISNEPGRWFWRRSVAEKPEVARVVGKQIVVDVWDRE
ncbi:MAG: hypothetical protein KF753_09970 [Caldilineaceae bacterium]|nr:hypothetical protein [Caldilineaceae bacterium]